MIKQPMQCYIESNINDETVKDKAGNDLLMIQNILADIGNGNQYCDDWNSEWEQMHPEYIGEDLNPGTEIGCKYGTFWAEKCNGLLKEINRLMDKSTVYVTCKSINGRVATVGILKSDPSKFVFLSK